MDTLIDLWYLEDSIHKKNKKNRSDNDEIEVER